MNLLYTRDHLGSIRELVDASNAAIRARYDYSPYGIRTKLAGDLDADFGYTGHYTNARTGLVLAPYRAYSPELGRWISRDPIEEEGGINLYGYVGNGPLGAVDLLGLDRTMNFAGHMWVTVDTYNKFGKKDGQCELHFAPILDGPDWFIERVGRSGLQISGNIVSNQEADELLMLLWRELAKADDINWNPGYNCAFASMQFLQYGIPDSSDTNPTIINYGSGVIIGGKPYPYPGF